MPTLKIDNFGGRLTRYDNGDINSGFAKYATTYGNDPYITPGRLTWYENLSRIDSGGTVITDLIVAGQERVESGVSYVYAVGHLGRVYKIQVNDPSNFNLNYDNPVLLATITSNSPTFTRGGSIDFFGSTERIYIGHDIGVTRIDFDGTNETFIGAAGSYTANVPRPLKQFLGNLYFGNGSNIGEINSSASLTTYTKLSPSFPSNTQVRDLDVSSGGDYLYAVVSRLALPSILSVTQDTTLLSSSESYVFKWNGTDTGYTSFNTFPSFSLTAYHTFGEYEYLFGYDIAGSTVFNPTRKILNPILTQAPLPNAVGSSGNFLAWAVPEWSNGFTKLSLFLYGPLDDEVKTGWWRTFQLAATNTETDILVSPFGLIVSGFVLGASTNGYTGGLASVGKTYFSTLEVAGSTPDYKLYRFYNVSGGLGTTMSGVYETQTQLFSNKITVKEVRIYTEPLVANNTFTIALTGSDGSVISNSSKTFSAGTSPVSVGDDLMRYTPAMGRTYALGVRITNSGTANWVCNKIEIDYEQAGK